jgi:hypothetical protein
MSDQFIFRRVEKKYRITPIQRARLLELVGERLTPDKHGKSTVCSLYLDTPDFLLIRNSIDAKAYKEKLRIRSYGTPSNDSKVFFEIKKKYKGIVYKRRASMTLAEARKYVNGGAPPFESQIIAEIDYAMRYYRHPAPAMLVACEREAFYSAENADLRLTFDSDVRYRTCDLSLASGADGTPIADGEIILEIKTGGAMPLWLAHALDACSIYPSSFSKYGTAYLRELKIRAEENTKGEYKNAGNL